VEGLSQFWVHGSPRRFVYYHCLFRFARHDDLGYSRWQHGRDADDGSEARDLL
jgi:hypothetical protein